MTIRNGTSGWSYAHWKDLFYPSQLARSVEGQGKTLGPMMCYCTHDVPCTKW
jgi:hypothetical protein